LKLEKWALIAEIVGAFAIVVTLIFLIVEIRGNSSAIRAATATSIADRTQTLILSSLANRTLMEARLRDANGDELSALDEIFLNQSHGASMKLAEESFIAFRDGNLDPDVWLTRAEIVLDNLASERERGRWAVRRESGWYVQDFVDYIDGELSMRYGQ
jgi:hypothetical protein